MKNLKGCKAISPLIITYIARTCRNKCNYYITCAAISENYCPVFRSGLVDGGVFSGL